MKPNGNRSGAGMLRLFVALDTPDAVKHEIAVVRDELASTGADVRWESTPKLHCTVKFLGDTQPDTVPLIDDALGRLCSRTPPLSVVYAGIGCFPGRRDPKVVWVGLQDRDGGTRALAERIEEAMERLGFAREPRAFHPHVTLGRVRSRRRLAELLARMETLTIESRPVVLPDLHLIQSELRPTGSVYTTLKMFPFAG